MTVSGWLSSNYIEVFGAVTGIVYIFLEIKQTVWLWPVGIITSAVYIWVFFTGKLYADMSLQGYYLVISCLAWYWWVRGTGEKVQDSGHRAQGSNTLSDGERWDVGTVPVGTEEEGETKDGEKRRTAEGGRETLKVTRLKLRTGFILVFFLLLLYVVMWTILSRFTDSPVPEWDSFLTSTSIIATWMLARKIYEHWFLWIMANSIYAVLFLTRGLYPTVILYIIYGIMSFAGLIEWKKTIKNELHDAKDKR
jgi:nicotinamide mononucleotide transporter